eukprot:TCALIF_07820-PA protein Name:"Protein of unknown function" AED:0.21 eAED:0.21 QI:2513/0.92/0.92/0.92/0.76/0.85/14/0/199
MVRDGKFEMFLSDFLFSKVGSRFKPKIIFEKEIVCNEPTSKIKATKSDITFVKFSGPEEHVPGRRLIENLIQTKKFSSKAFSFSKVYAAWETDEVISFELWRNLALAMVCVFIITLVLLANVKICLMVLSCVCLTLTIQGIPVAQLHGPERPNTLILETPGRPELESMVHSDDLSDSSEHCYPRKHSFSQSNEITVAEH